MPFIYLFIFFFLDFFPCLGEDENQITVKFDGVVDIDDLREVTRVNQEGQKEVIVVSRSAEFKVVDPLLLIAWCRQPRR